MKSFHGNIYQKKKIGYWHDLSQNELFKYRNKKISDLDKNKFIYNLNKIGYSKKKRIKKANFLNILTIAFQRRFRQELINGVIDKECLRISNNLVKKF